MYSLPEEDMRIMGARLRDYRIHAEMTQAELAERIGVTPLTVSRMERGGNVLMYPFIAALKVLRIPSTVERMVPQRKEYSKKDILTGKTRKRFRSCKSYKA